MEFYHHKNRRKYNLSAHIVLVTKYRKPLLVNQIKESTKECILKICKVNNIKINAMECDIDHIHILIDYKPTITICDIVKILKQATTYSLWQQYHNLLSTYYWKRKIFWSDGYFVCSVGNASEETIQHYIDSQC